MPRTDTPKTELTYLDKRIFCELQGGKKVIFLGMYKATTRGARNPPEFISLNDDEGFVLNASLQRVTPKLVFYRQVMEAA